MLLWFFSATDTVRFYFDVSAFETPLHLKKRGGVSVKIWPIVEHAFQEEIHNRGNIFV